MMTPTTPMNRELDDISVVLWKSGFWFLSATFYWSRNPNLGFICTRPYDPNAAPKENGPLAGPKFLGQVYS